MNQAITTLFGPLQNDAMGWTTSSQLSMNVPNLPISLGTVRYMIRPQAEYLERQVKSVGL